MLHAPRLVPSAITATLVAAVLLLGGCGTVDSGNRTGDRPTAATSSEPTATPAPKGPWDAYGLPAPGSPGTGKTVARGKITFIGRANLDDLSGAEVTKTRAKLTDLYDRAYWDLPSLAQGKQTPNMFRDDMDAPTNRYFNEHVKKDGDTTFGLYTAKDVTPVYDWRVSDITIHALDSYISNGRRVAHLRTTFTTRWISLPVKYHGKWQKAKRCSIEADLESWVGDMDGDGDVELAGWGGPGADINCAKLPKNP